MFIEILPGLAQLYSWVWWIHTRSVDTYLFLQTLTWLSVENNGEIDDGFHASVILAPLLNNAQWHQDFISARFFDHKLSKHLLRGIVSVKILLTFSKYNGLLVRSQTTLTSWWLFWPPIPLCWHFIPYKHWRKVNISGLPTHLFLST